MKKYILYFLLLMPASLFGQTLTDGLMMPKKVLCTGFMFTHDRWTNYWEGTLRRDNENIGTLTTNSLIWAGSYGLSDKLNFIAMLPYVQTQASAGNMSGMQGLQDLTLGIKYNFLDKVFQYSRLKTFAVLGFSTPMSDYTPDYFPFSLGTHTTNLAWRLNAYYRLDQGYYANLTGAYTWRSNTTLDREAYYTDGQMHLTNEVKMPNMMDYTASLGYLKGGLQTEVFLLQQQTLGGGDIRRQDMPFVSNRMNFTKAGALLMYYLPMHKNLAVRASFSTTLTGRNVGQSNSIMGGLMYTIPFTKTTKTDSQP